MYITSEELFLRAIQLLGGESNSWLYRRITAVVPQNYRRITAELSYRRNLRILLEGSVD